MIFGVLGVCAIRSSIQYRGTGLAHEVLVSAIAVYLSLMLIAALGCAWIFAESIQIIFVVLYRKSTS
jgi:hypothetical protein